MSTTLIRPVATVGIDGTEFSIESGNAKLDAGAVPYARATVVVPVLDDADLDWLDPRDNVRCPIDAGDLSGAGRTFDLGLRSRTADHEAKTVTLELASDEALLQDYSVLTTDKGARAYQASLRAVVDYVLDKTLGASLEAGADDANVTAYWNVTNLHPNPSVTSTTAGFRVTPSSSAPTWISFGGTDPGSCRWTAAAGVSSFIAGDATTSFRVTPGKTYVFSCELVSSISRPAQVGLQWLSNGGLIAFTPSYGPTASTGTGAFTRYTVIATAPAGAEFVNPFVTTSSNTAGQFHYIDAVLLYEGDELVPFFTGATTDTSTYIYDWTGPVNGSPSNRVAVTERPPAVFTWQPGVTAWDFLMTLTAAENMVLWCDEARQWFLSTPENRTVSGVVALSAFNVRSGTDELSRDNAESFSTGVALRYSWTDGDNIQRTATDTAGLPEKVYSLTFNDTPYPGPGVAAAMLARRQGTGRVQDVDAITVWTATPGMTASVALPGAPDTLGRVASLDFDLAVGFMRVGTSGLVDIIPGSIAALTGTIASLPGTIAGL